MFRAAVVVAVAIQRVAGAGEDGFEVGEEFIHGRNIEKLERKEPLGC